MCFRRQQTRFSRPSHGITPIKEKVQAICDFPVPESQRKLRQFIGLVNFYHRFLPHGAELMQPLHTLLTPTKTRAQTIAWHDTAKAVFDATKEAMPLSYTTDASDTAVGPLLQQHVAGTWCPISFFSKKLKPSETRHSTFDRELLAVYLDIFFTSLKVDSSMRMYALHTHHSPRQAHHLDYISQFTSNIRHIHGADNVVADALSRIETNVLLSGQPPVVDFTAMATADPQIRALQSSPSFPLVVKAIPLAKSSDTLLCDISAGAQRPLVPRQWRCTAFESLHGLSHPGIRATQRLITARYVWPGVNADVRRWTHSCIQC